MLVDGNINFSGNGNACNGKKPNKGNAVGEVS
jgi:hypothetical protein